MAAPPRELAVLQRAERLANGWCTGPRIRASITSLRRFFVVDDCFHSIFVLKFDTFVTLDNMVTTHTRGEWNPGLAS